MDRVFQFENITSDMKSADEHRMMYEMIANMIL